LGKEISRAIGHHIFIIQIYIHIHNKTLIMEKNEGKSTGDVSVEQREQMNSWVAWLESKQLRLLQPEWNSPRELVRFLVAAGCDVSLWGQEKNTKNVEALYRELKKFRSCLCEAKSGQILRCVSSLRVRFVGLDAQVLVEEELSPSGMVVQSPLSIRLKLGESPFRAAERLLFGLTGMEVHRATKEYFVDPGNTCRLNRESLSMRGTTYEPLQYENPLEYESLSSSTYPTLSTIYRMNVLTLRLSELGNPEENVVKAAAKMNKSISWIDAEKARHIYTHLELGKTQHAKSKGLDAKHHHEDLDEADEMAYVDVQKSLTWDEGRNQPESYDAFISLENDLQSGFPETLGSNNHTLLHIAQKQRFSGPASVTEGPARVQMSSVIVDLIGQGQAYLEKLRREHAIRVVQRMDWMTSVSHRIGEIAAEARQLATPSKAQPGRRKSLQNLKTRKTVTSLIQRITKDQQMTTVFRTMSFDKYGHLSPLLDCSWFRKIQRSHAQMVKSIDHVAGSFRPSAEALELFRLWLSSAGLDVGLYTDHMILELLEEALLQKSELSLDPSSRRLQRIVRIAKVAIYDHSSDDSDESKMIKKRYLEVPPSYSRRLVVQKIAASPPGLHMSVDFNTVLNQKARGNEYMLDVVDSILEKNFRTEIKNSHGESKYCQPLVKSLYMFEPRAETNVSPSFPGLSSTYYLHQFWVRLSGIPRHGNFTVTRRDKKGREETFFWMWVKNVATEILEKRTHMLEYFLGRPECRLNLVQKIAHVPLGSTVEIFVDQSLLELYKLQLKEGCKINDPELVRFALAKIKGNPATHEWDLKRQTQEVMEAIGVALESKSYRATYTLLSFYKRITVENLPVNESSSPSYGEPFSPLAQNSAAASKPFHMYFNNVLIIASLINAQNVVYDMKEALVVQKIEKLSAAPFCVRAAVSLRHPHMLRCLLEMSPHFVNGPFYPSKDDEEVATSVSFRDLPNKLVPLWIDTKRTKKKFRMTEDVINLLRRQTGPDLHVFVPGFQTFSSRQPAKYQQFLCGRITDIAKCCIPSSWKKRWGSSGAKVHVLDDPYASSTMSPQDPHQPFKIRPFGWDGLLEAIYPPEQAKWGRPLSSRQTKMLGTALSVCPPDHVLYKTYLEVFLISIVAVCWNDVTIFGYELESQRMIIEFLEDCNYPFHTTLKMIQMLRKLSRGKSYFGSELKFLHDWVHEQAVRMLDSCAAQEEANAVLFEQIRVEHEETTLQVFRKRESLENGVPTMSSSAIDTLPPPATSALYIAIACKVKNVVSSKWFQGTNENKIWFYEWWRPDKFPSVYEKHASSLMGTAFLTLVIFLELLIMMPVWCMAPFSVDLSLWRDRLAINSAYFKFLSHTMLHCAFVLLVLVNSLSQGPIQVDSLVVNPMGGAERLMYIWVLGLVAAEAQAIYFDPSEYLSSAVNFIDLTFLGFFSSAFVFRLVASSLADSKAQPFVDMHGIFQWFDPDGSWTAFAAASLSEMLLACGALIAIYRLVHLSSFHPRLGPLYDSILKMGGDVAFYMYVLLILLFGNSVAMMYILRRYDNGGSTYLTVTPEEGIQRSMMSSGISGVMAVLGQSLFSGEVPGSDDIIVMSETDTLAFYSLIVLHLLVIVIVCQNLLIAMMNQTYQQTQDSSQVVYLNGRMELINDYAGLPVVPPPFNLITIPFELLALLVNYLRYGNPRAVYQQLMKRTDEGFKTSLPTSLGGMSSAPNFDLLHQKKAEIAEPRLQGLKIKKKYGINNSMRKVRVGVFKKYFAEIRRELGMQDRSNDQPINRNKSSPPLPAKEKETPLPQRSQSEPDFPFVDSFQIGTDLDKMSPTIAEYLAKRTAR